MEAHRISRISGFAALFILCGLLAFLPNSLLFVLLKGALLFGGLGGVWRWSDYLTGAELPAVEDKEDSSSREKEENSLQNWLKIEDDRDIEVIFNSFLGSIIPLLRKTMVAETVVLLLANFSKKKFYLRYRDSQHKESLAKEQFLDFNLGLPALILKNKNSIIENHLPDNENIIPYYKEGTIQPNSFLGTPVYYEQHAIGVLCADSSVEEAFSNEDLEIMQLVSQLISIQLASSNKLYEYETENWIAGILYDFSKNLALMKTRKDLWEFCGPILRTNFSADRVFITLRKNDESAQVVSVTGENRGVKIGQNFPLSEGLIGWVLRKNQSLLVDDLARQTNYIPRLQLNELQSREFRSLLAVPICEGKEVTGALCLESFRPQGFKAQHKKILETIAYQVGGFLEKSAAISLLEEQNLIDTATGIGNEKAFTRNLQMEIGRSRKNKRKFVLILIKSKIKSKNDDQYPTALREFLEFSLPYFDQTDYIFRLSNDIFAVMLVESELRTVLPAVQKYCDAVVRENVWVERQIQKLTINCGLVQYPEMGYSLTELWENARAALKRAEEKGPNEFSIPEKAEEINS